MEIRVREQYKTVKGWSGKRYRVQMTNAEIEARRICGLIFAAVVCMPALVLIMAKAAGLI